MPGKRGRKFKIGPELLDAVAAKQALSQARGVEMGSRSILQYLALRNRHPQGQKYLGWVRIGPVDQLDPEFARIGAGGAEFWW